jgi:hypothetical protein
MRDNHPLSVIMTCRAELAATISLLSLQYGFDSPPSSHLAMNQRITPSPDVIRQAKARPNGWVYQIEGRFSNEQRIPPDAIIGAWEVNELGQLTGRFVDNPRYKPMARFRRFIFSLFW